MWVEDSEESSCSCSPYRASRRASTHSIVIKVKGDKVRQDRRSEKHAGHSCDVYTLDDSDAERPMFYEFCIAADLHLDASSPLGALLAGGTCSSLRCAESVDELASKGVPLRIEASDRVLAGGATIMKREATRVESKGLNDADFQVPAGYVDARRAPAK